MKLRVYLRRSLALLPKSVRHELFRAQLQINLHPDPCLEIKLAEDEAELESAFRILHDAYVDSGFMKPSPSGMRVTKYHALPSTSTLVAKWDGEVVATLSIIRDGSFGLPLEGGFDISRFRAGGKRPVEISSLAIKPGFRGNRGETLLPLLKAMWLYCTKYFGVDDLLIAVNPRRVEFFEAILGFKKITDTIVEEYGFVNGAPAVGLYLSVAEARAIFAKAYYGKEPAKDLYTYMIDASEGGRTIESIKFPDRSYHDISDPIMTPDLFKTFFMEKTDVFDSLTPEERQIILGAYNEPGGPLYHSILKSWKDAPKPTRMRRYDVNFNARVVGPSRTLDGRVFNVSREGFLLAVNGPLEDQDFYHCRIQVSDFEILSVTAQKIWDFGDGFVGLKLLNAEETWDKMIKDFDRTFTERIFRKGA